MSAVKKKLIIIGASVVVLAIAAVGVFHYFRQTPEYVLMKISSDIKESGIDGLRPHLTEEAREKVDAITAITENKLLNTIVSFLDKKDYVGVLKSEIQVVQWELEDIMKGKNNADVLLAFNYDDRLIGTIEISMVKCSDGWKIAGLEMPQFKEINW